MQNKIKELQLRKKELESRIADPDFSMHEDYIKVTQEYNEINKILDLWEKLEKAKKQFQENKDIIEKNEDKELIKIAKEENKILEKNIENWKLKIENYLNPPDPMDNKNIIMEIRPAAGGEEAALFAEELFRMYSRFAEKKGFAISILSWNRTDLGGIKEMIFEIIGQGAYSYFKYEMGVHRVQRIPETESQGRIHTSTVTVAVLPEAEEVDVKINPDDLKIDVFRSSGPGGQSVNTTDSAVRITHIPTGMVVTCQDEKSQLKNKEKALKVLRSRLYEQEQEKMRKERGEEKRGQIGTGGRAEKIRTYNFPQNRVTDHRIQKSWHNLEEVLSGELDDIIKSLQEADKK